jgi:hypothetical protein
LELYPNDEPMKKILFTMTTLLAIPGSVCSQPKFEQQLLDDKVSIGYGLAIADVNGDNKPDILLADKKQFVWYRNGDWKRFVMVENLTESDNVCIAARDIDGDGKVEVAVGAQWNPGETSDTVRSGSVHFLIRPSDPTQRWTPVQLHHEPTVHRMKWVKVGNKFHLVVVPLHGRENKNGEGAGVRIYAYEKPRDARSPWKYYLIDQSMHLTHNFDVLAKDAGEWILVGGREGTRTFAFDGKKWSPIGDASRIKDEPYGEIRSGNFGRASSIAGVQPMHGSELTINDGKNKVVLTNQLNQGHALACADVLGLGYDQIIVGWREPNTDNKVGIKIFYNVSFTEGTSRESWVDENDMACEDLQVADLDGDGKKDIVAAGRATHNLKIYWNKSH